MAGVLAQAISRVRSEYRYLSGTLRMFARLIPILKRPNRTVSDQIADLAKRHAAREALIQGRDIFTYGELDARATQYAHWATGEGIGKGDVVALYMSNRPEFMVAWLGLARAGAVVALINTNQVGSSLAYSFNIVAPKAVVLGAEMAVQFGGVTGQLEHDPTIWVQGAGDGTPNAGSDLNANDLDEALGKEPIVWLELSERPQLTIDDPCLYIFTSGTTGMPKAATISHYRVLAIMNGFSAVMGARKTDRMYVALPLYHSSGGLLACGAVLTVGGAAIIRQNFSAGNFWREIVKSEATLFQYIGELCRYLVNAPECAEERQHKIRLCCGNGLRPDIWQGFEDRFGLPRILEFYGATEGNVVLLNHDGRPGSVGRIPFWAKPLFPIEVIGYDITLQTERRDGGGNCVKCEPNEVGEVIGEVRRGATAPTSRFDGYADKQATGKKVLRDVFSPGDQWFRTGDLMRQDEAGYFYFVDRIGDTFRWRGENVSTSEVAETLTQFPGVEVANVYGVEVPGHDGRAGMAALLVNEVEWDISALPGFLATKLPSYACPRFIRLRRQIEVTATFKQKKVKLVEDGYDPQKMDGDLYYSESDSGLYRPLTGKLYRDIMSGQKELR